MARAYVKHTCNLFNRIIHSLNALAKFRREGGSTSNGQKDVLLNALVGCMDAAHRELVILIEQI